MPTNLITAVESYTRARNLSSGTRDEYSSTVTKWSEWGSGVPIEDLRRTHIVRRTTTHMCPSHRLKSLAIPWAA